jgi:hypothetical protein
MRVVLDTNVLVSVARAGWWSAVTPTSGPSRGTALDVIRRPTFPPTRCQDSHHGSCFHGLDEGWSLFPEVSHECKRQRALKLGVGLA